MSDVTIRPAADDDYDGLAAVYIEVDELHREALPRMFRAPDGPALGRAYFASMLAGEDSALIVADRGGAIVGFARLQARLAPDTPYHRPRRWVEVDTLAVLSEVQRGGVGRALMLAAESWARERGIAEIELNVYEFNRRAIAFYERIGYVTQSRRMRRSLDDANS